MLYFRPSLDVEDEDPGSSHGDYFNPLLVRCFPNILYDLNAHAKARYSAEERAELRSKVRIFDDLPWAQDEKSIAKILNKDASWRRMLVSRRRINKLTVFYTPEYATYFKSQFIEFDFSTYGPLGMTMGGYYDLILSRLPIPTPLSPLSLLLPGRTSTHKGPFRYYNHHNGPWAERTKVKCFGQDAFPYTFHYTEPSVDGAILLSNVFKLQAFRFKRNDPRCKWQVLGGLALPEVSVVRSIGVDYDFV